MRHALLLCALLLPMLASAQIEVEISDVSTVQGDYTQGPPVVVFPPRSPDGKQDLELYKLLTQALREKLAARLIADDVTLKAIAAQKKGATSAEIVAAVSAEVKAAVVITFALTATRLEAQVSNREGEIVPVKVGLARSKKKPDLSQAKVWVADILRAGKAKLIPPPPAPPPPKVAATFIEVAPAPLVQEGVSDVAEESVRDRVNRQHTRNPLGPAIVLLVGGGTSFRNLSGTTNSRAVVPSSPNVIGSLGFNATIYPFRLIDSTSEKRIADLYVEGAYRINLARAVDSVGANPGPCGVSDDEYFVRAGYRWHFGLRGPRIGASVGYAAERTQFTNCSAPTLSTEYKSFEAQLQIAQPIVGELLALQLSGGPRVVFSPHASGRTNQAFSAEGWLASRPVEHFYLRAGARITDTMLTSWPEGIAITDLKIFAGLEIGAAL